MLVVRRSLFGILRWILVLALGVPIWGPGFATQVQFSRYETGKRFTEAPHNRLDVLVAASLCEKGVEPVNQCSDEVFIRRVYLDVIGTLPEPKEVRDFLRSYNPRKWAALIHAFLKRDEFADYADSIGEQ
ncbi:MAG: DUF1549 domain-containing protein [Sedimentisphaerales bacterium]|jgi:hypothetical protein